MDFKSLALDTSTLYMHSKMIQALEQFSVFDSHLTHSHTMTPFDAPGKQAF